MNRSLYSFLHIKWSNKDENWKQLKQFDMYLRERRQLSFVTLNGNFAVKLKPSHPSLLNGQGQFTFLKTKSSHSSGIYPPKFELLRN